jgi:autotransporter-associated beta strand protein
MKIQNSIKLTGLQKAALCIAFLTLATGAAQAATWDGGGSDDNWSTGANWDTAPSFPEALRFDGTTRLNPNNDFAAGQSVTGITFGTASWDNLNTAGSFTLGGNAIDLDGTIMQNDNVGTHTINLDMAIDAERTIDLNGTAVLEIGGVISGTGGLWVQGLAQRTMRLTGQNTFTGDVKVENAQLEVDSIADGGSNSALGAGTGAITLGRGSFAGVLRYTGSANASTDRQITFSTLNQAAEGAQAIIENNGTGTLTFSNANFNLANNNTPDRDFVFGGSNTGDNTVQGIIADNTAGTVLVEKNGTGKWVLSGDNTYTGATSVNAGTLQIDGDQSAASGAVTVASGATLSGSGTIGGATTVQSGAFLAPGNSPGVLTFDDALTLEGTTTMEILGTARGTEYDGIDVNGALSYGGALVLSADSLIADGTYDLFGILGTESGDFASISLSGLAYSGETFSFDSSDTWTATVGSQEFTFLQSTGDLTVIPEPGTFALLAGFFGLGYVMVRRRS